MTEIHFPEASLQWIYFLLIVEQQTLQMLVVRDTLSDL